MLDILYVALTAVTTSRPHRTLSPPFRKAAATEHLPVALPGKVVDNGGRGHRLACAWRALDEAQWSLQHGLHSIDLRGQSVSAAAKGGAAPPEAPQPRPRPEAGST